MTYSEQTDSVYTRPLNIYRALLYTLYNDDRGEAGISELCRRRTSVIKGRETTTMPLPPPSVSQTTKYAAFWEGPRRAYLPNHARSPTDSRACEPGAAEYVR